MTASPAGMRSTSKQFKLLIPLGAPGPDRRAP